jgi:hypothetical protein
MNRRLHVEQWVLEASPPLKFLRLKIKLSSSFSARVAYTCALIRERSIDTLVLVRRNISDSYSF